MIIYIIYLFLKKGGILVEKQINFLIRGMNDTDWIEFKKICVDERISLNEKIKSFIYKFLETQKNKTINC